MSVLTAAGAQAAYRTKRPDDALAMADQVVAQNPHDAAAHLVRALVLLRRRDIAPSIVAMRACLRVRSGEWLLERCRRDVELHGVPALTQAMAIMLGGLLRGSLPQYSPPLPPELRRAQHDYINVVGSSYVRSFGGSPAVFPLYIGQGPYTLFLDEISAATTRRMVMANLKRVDPRRNTLLILGSDPSYHLQQVRMRGEDRPDGVIAADFAVMDAVAERHGVMLSEAKALITGKVILLGVTPHVHDETNVLGLYLNSRLKTVCAEVGVEFLDAWAALVDPATARLREELSAQAYEGDAHFKTEATELFVTLLQEAGYLGRDAPTASDFRWSHVFEAEIDPADRTRLWCEPSIHPRNAFQSHKIASAFLEKVVADLLIGLSIQPPSQPLLMVNVREAFLPSVLPAHVHSGCLAFTDGQDNLKVGRTVLDFFGRLDTRLELPDSFDTIGDQIWDRAVLLLHPDSLEADEARCNAVLSRLPDSTGVIVGTPRPDRLERLRLGGRKVFNATIGNRHIPEEWRAYSVAVAQGA